MNDEKRSAFLDAPEEMQETPYEEPGPTGAAIALCALAVMVILGLIFLWFFSMAVAALIGYPLASIVLLGSAFGGVVYWSLDLTAG